MTAAARADWETHELTLGFCRETERAWRVTNTGRDADGVWLPKQFVERETRRVVWPDPEDCKLGVWRCTLPLWLARERKLA